ncbi:UNVERIFIED_CONTAM: hypothetical protein Sradi_0296100 [Sesamum radiatum]|uniref:Uncharacterized protein n=1 Tax=Sesamum radiatum TaxID=300843 RepID=A0AAW2W256_SESRA
MPSKSAFIFCGHSFLGCYAGICYSKAAFKVHSNRHRHSEINDPLIGNKRELVKTSFWFKLTLTVTGVVAVLSTVLCILAFVGTAEFHGRL